MSTTTQTNPAQSAQSRVVARPNSYRPMFDVWKTGDRVVLQGDVPGVAPNDLDIRFVDGILTLTAKVDSRLPSERQIRREYGVGDYKRQFAIAETIDSSGISAQLRDGVVTIELPIVVKPQSRRIEIHSAM